MKEKNKEIAERESQRADASLNMTPENILREIFYFSSRPPSEGTETALSRSLAYFSSLLIVLSRQADESTKKIVKLTATLTCLTWVIAILTAILLFVTFFEFPKYPIFGTQKIKTTIQNTK